MGDIFMAVAVGRVLICFDFRQELETSAASTMFENFVNCKEVDNTQSL
jgi:hypothetical protein